MQTSAGVAALRGAWLFTAANVKFVAFAFVSVQPLPARKTAIADVSTVPVELVSLHVGVAP